MSQDEGLSHTKTRPVTLERQFSEAFGKTWRNIGHEMTNGHSENRATFEHKTWYLGRGEWSKEKGWRLGTGSETMSSRVRIERVGSQQWQEGPNLQRFARSHRIYLAESCRSEWQENEKPTPLSEWQGEKMNWKESRRLMGKISSLETYDWTETQIKYYLLIQCLSLEI